uniref:Uncharacterized protein n=1 Tax=Oryza glumipatula TaxID=40148 RepID=A0A0D9ZH87_9ORYZ
MAMAVSGELATTALVAARSKALLSRASRAGASFVGTRCWRLWISACGSELPCPRRRRAKTSSSMGAQDQGEMVTQGFILAQALNMR